MLIDIRKERDGAYRAEIVDNDGHWIKKFGDLDTKVVEEYMGSMLAGQLDLAAEYVDRLPVGSSIHIADNLTEVRRVDNLIATLPVGLDEFTTTSEVLDKIVTPPTSDGPLDLTGGE